MRAENRGMSSSRSPRTFAALGVTILLLGVAGGAGIYLVGSSFRVVASPSLQSVSLGNASTTNLCGALRNPDRCASGVYTGSAGMVFVAPGNRYLVSIMETANSTGNVSGVGEILEVAGGSLARIAQFPLPCLPYSNGLSYPGFGPYAFQICSKGWNDSIAVVNWATGTVAGVFHMASTPSWDFAPFISVALAPSSPTAFAAVAPSGGPTPAPFLLTLNLATDSEVANVSLPAGSSPSIYSNSSGTGVAVVEPSGNRTESTIDLVDPTTGQVTRAIALPGGLDDCLPGETPGQLSACYYPGFSTTAEVVTLSTETLQLLSTIPLPMGLPWTLAEPQAVLDPGAGDLYLIGNSFLPQVVAVNESSGQVVGTLDYNPSDQFAPQGTMTFDPRAETLAFSGSLANQTWPVPTDLSNPGLFEMNVSHGNNPQPSYSAVPWVGTALPAVTVVVGLGAGAVLLLVAGMIRRRQARQEAYLRLLLPRP